MRQKKNRSERKKAEYTEFNKTVKKKKRRQRLRMKRTDHVKLYFKVVEVQTGYTKKDKSKRYVK